MSCVEIGCPWYPSWGLMHTTHNNKTRENKVISQIDKIINKSVIVHKIRPALRTNQIGI